MNHIRPLILGGLASLLCAAGLCEESPKAVSLELTQAAGNYVLTVPVSSLVMTIPKGGLVPATTAAGGSTASPRYFYFEDRSLRLYLSGWFESDQGYSDIHKLWAEETAAWKRKNLPAPQDVSFEKLGGWNAILYDLVTPEGNDSHTRAHWLQAGTWIDLHLSMAADRPPSEIRAKLRDFLKTIKVTEKVGGDPSR